MADRIVEYHEVGFDEFILSGYPHLEEAYWFGEGVRRCSARAACSPPMRPPPAPPPAPTASPRLPRRGGGIGRAMATRELSPARLASAEDALGAAEALARPIAEESASRDRLRTPPLEQLELIAGSGLLAIAVPPEHGGPGLPASVVAEVFRGLARADSSVAQLLLAHFVLLDTLAELPADHPTARLIFADVLAGAQLGNAAAERGTKHGWTHSTRATPDPTGGWRFNGRKYYATGSLGARWIAVSALVAEGHPVTGFVDPAAEGLTLALEDWSSFGQRSTFSGTVLLDGVHVPEELVLDRGPTDPDPGPPFTAPTTR